jgi:hypothetical protein
MIYQITLEDTQVGGITVVHVSEISVRHLGITNPIRL